MARVHTLTYYPIKACAGVNADRVEVGWAGPRHDRCFVIGKPDGMFLSQRQVARLAVIRPRVLHEGAKLALSAPGVDDTVVEVDPDGREQTVVVHNEPLTGVDQGEDAAGWLSEVLGMPVRLFRAPEGGIARVTARSRAASGSPTPPRCSSPHCPLWMN